MLHHVRAIPIDHVGLALIVRIQMRHIKQQLQHICIVIPSLKGELLCSPLFLYQTFPLYPYSIVRVRQIRKIRKARRRACSLIGDGIVPPRHIPIDSHIPIDNGGIIGNCIEALITHLIQPRAQPVPINLCRLCRTPKSLSLRLPFSILISSAVKLRQVQIGSRHLVCRNRHDQPVPVSWRIVINPRLIRIRIQTAYQFLSPNLHLLLKIHKLRALIRDLLCGLLKQTLPRNHDQER